MGTKIRIRAGKVEAEAELFDTHCAQQIAAALPLHSRANTWGDEVYFNIPVATCEENAQEVVEAGDLGYWPPGNAFCIFFGPTPASRGSEIRPASPVNVIGKLAGDPKVFKAVRGGEAVTVELAQD